MIPVSLENLGLRTYQATGGTGLATIELSLGYTTLSWLFCYSPSEKEMLCIGSNYGLPSMINNAVQLVSFSERDAYHG